MCLVSNDNLASISDTQLERPFPTTRSRHEAHIPFHSLIPSPLISYLISHKTLLIVAIAFATTDALRIDYRTKRNTAYLS